MARLPLVSPLDRALFLKAQPYLEGVSSNVLAALASYSEERFYRAGTLIRESGAHIDRIVFLGQGRVEVGGTEDAATSSRPIEAPGAIGLAHHFAAAPRPPAVRALSDTLCLEIGCDDLDQILEDYFSLLLQMAQTTCHQVTLVVQALGDRRPPPMGFGESAREHTPAQLDLVARLARLKHAPFFAGTNLGVLSELVRFDPPSHVPAGEVLWREGEAIDRMVVVLDGEFRSIGRHGSVRAPSGSMIGAWELFLDAPRYEGWVAEVPSRVVSIGRELFIDVLEDHFEFAQTYLDHASSYLIAGWDELAMRDGSDQALVPHEGRERA